MPATVLPVTMPGSVDGPVLGVHTVTVIVDSPAPDAAGSGFTGTVACGWGWV
jgi:hypothetical protein